MNALVSKEIKDFKTGNPSERVKSNWQVSFDKEVVRCVRGGVMSSRGKDSTSGKKKRCSRLQRCNPVDKIKNRLAQKEPKLT